MPRVDSFLELAVKQKGSDLHLVSGNVPRIRLYGDLFPVKYRSLSPEETAELIYEVMNERAKRAFDAQRNLDFAYEVEGLSRFRVNVFRHVGGVGAVFRVIPGEVQTIEELGLPQAVKGFCKQRKGLVLVTGPTGSGKSTTLAAMVDSINQDRREHIITIEDPVEFVHRRKNCLISHREVGSHAPSFAAALRSALREDPNIVLVGELRDLETIGLVVTAAEMGILVLATLHTSGASSTVDRMINVFPAVEQSRVRAMLSTSLCGIVSQQLLRRADGKGRVAAFEVLIATPAAANLIREGKPEQLTTVIQSGGLQGMQTLDTSLRRLLDAKLITGKEAYRKAINKAAFERFLDKEDTL
jgi:twitching motility protein PilT